jgi:hypothetical protein
LSNTAIAAGSGLETGVGRGAFVAVAATEFVAAAAPTSAGLAPQSMPPTTAANSIAITPAVRPTLRARRFDGGLWGMAPE